MKRASHTYHSTTMNRGQRGQSLNNDDDAMINNKMETRNKVLGEIGQLLSTSPTTESNFISNSKKKRRRRRSYGGRRGRAQFNMAVVPIEIWTRIFFFCDSLTLEAVRMTCTLFYNIVQASSIPRPLTITIQNKGLATMPSEIILTVFKFLPRSDLASCALVCSRFRDLMAADCLWLVEAKNSLATNMINPDMKSRNVKQYLTAQDRVRISRNWTRGYYSDRQLIVQNTRYMPRVQIDAQTLWVSWGTQVWAHPRRPDGTVCRTASKVLRGHSDDVSRFVVKDNFVVSGGRDKTLVAWRQTSNRNYDFAFAKRYCHGSEISAVDVAGRGSLVVSGSRDRFVKIWRLSNNTNDVPVLLTEYNIQDRVWSLASSNSNVLAVGTAGLGGIPSLNMFDLDTGMPTNIGISSGLRKGAGMLDLQWMDNYNLLSCGYDSFARLWDTRAGQCVRKWEEPFDEAVYCLATDNNMTLVCGTARHGLVRLWDMRHSSPVQMYYVKHPHNGQSSPVYSVAFDPSNLYVALDQSLNLINFYGRNNHLTNRPYASFSYNHYR